jgi:hypothetical protein
MGLKKKKGKVSKDDTYRFDIDRALITNRIDRGLVANGVVIRLVISNSRKKQARLDRRQTG